MSASVSISRTLRGRVPRPGGQVDDELVTASEQMRQTRLVGGVLEAPVGSPAVSHHDAGELRRDHLAGLVEAAAVGHPVRSGVTGRSHPEPGTFAADAPSRLVGHDHGRVVHGFDDRGLHRDEGGRG